MSVADHQRLLHVKSILAGNSDEKEQKSAEHFSKTRMLADVLCEEFRPSNEEDINPVKENART